MMLPGTLIKTGLEFMGVDPSTCNCVERAALMDEWGIEGCRVHVEQIVGWFVDEGRKHSIVDSQTPQFRRIVRQMILFAISRSEQLMGGFSLAINPAGPDENHIPDPDLPNFPVDADDTPDPAPKADDGDGIELGFEGLEEDE